MGKENETIQLIHADDGEPICDFIKNYLSSPKFNFSVLVTDMSESELPQRCMLTVILLTPDMIQELQEKSPSDLSKLVARSIQKAWLCHEETVNLANKGTQRVLESCCPDYKSWNTIYTGDTNTEFKHALLRIVELMEKNPGSTPMLLGFKVTPKRLWKANDDVIITFKKEKLQGKVTAVLEKKGFKKEVKCVELNKMTYMFKPEGMPEGNISIEVFKDQVSAGKTNITIRSKIERLSSVIEEVNDPLSFLCQTMKCNDKDTLDHEMVDILTNGDRSSNPLACLAGLENRKDLFHVTSSQEYPTLLHFGAKFGLTKFCNILKNYPGYGPAHTMTNKHGKMPCQIALLGGFTDLAADLLPAESFENNEMESCKTRESSSSDEGGYTTMEDLEIRDSLHGKRPPELPRRPSDIENVVMRRKKTHSDFEERDSGVNSSTDMGSSRDTLPRRSQMTDRMTKVWEDELQLPKNLFHDTKL